MRNALQRTAIRKRPMKLGTTVILMVSAVLFSVLLVVHLIYFSQISNMTRDALADKALAVARTLADSPEIRQGLQKAPQESGIQAIARAVNKSNDFLFIVVTNMQSIRYSHPEAQRIGQRFKGDDILLAPKGKRTSQSIVAFWLKHCACLPLSMTKTTAKLASYRLALSSAESLNRLITVATVSSGPSYLVFWWACWVPGVGQGAQTYSVWPRTL